MPDSVPNDPFGVSLPEEPPAPAPGLRATTARGVIINAVFWIGVSLLGFVRGFILAGLLTTSDYGVWGILVIALGTLLWLKQVGIGDKYIQQSDADQEVAFQKAFTLEVLFTGAFALLLAAALPVIAIVYGRPELLAPGFALIGLLPAAVLQTPLWVYYRRMDYARQRRLQAIDPIVAFVVTVGLAIAGAGYWALVIGILAGSWSAAIVAVVRSPYPLRLRYDRGTLRSYASFSWPLVLATGAGMVIAQASILLGEQELGLAGAGAITLAATISQFTDRLDAIISETLYPAVARVAERTEVLFETFVKSNRLALMWAMPFGLGLSLFASDVVRFGIGEKWRAAVVLLQVFGAAAAVNQIGFNYDAYFRARNDTRPIALVSVASLAAFAVVAVPLLITEGLDGFAGGIGAMCVVTIAARAYFLQRLFRGFEPLRHIVRAIAPVIPAAALVLGARVTESAAGVHRGLAIALGELAVFVVVSLLATVALERTLLREMLGYLARRPAPA